jgi:hypothetical protein
MPAKETLMSGFMRGNLPSWRWSVVSGQWPVISFQWSVRIDLFVHDTRAAMKVVPVVALRYE